CRETHLRIRIAQSISDQAVSSLIGHCEAGRLNDLLALIRIGIFGAIRNYLPCVLSRIGSSCPLSTTDGRQEGEDEDEYFRHRKRTAALARAAAQCRMPMTN